MGTAVTDRDEQDTESESQKQFFEYAGPLFSVQISPALSVLAIERSRTLRAVARDRARRIVEHELKFEWRIVEGGGRLDGEDREIVEFHAPEEPGLTRVSVTVTQARVTANAEAIRAINPIYNRHPHAISSALIDDRVIPMLCLGNNDFGNLSSGFLMYQG